MSAVPQGSGSCSRGDSSQTSQLHTAAATMSDKKHLLCAQTGAGVPGQGAQGSFAKGTPGQRGAQGVQGGQYRNVSRNQGGRNSGNYFGGGRGAVRQRQPKQVAQAGAPQNRHELGSVARPGSKKFSNYADFGQGNIGGGGKFNKKAFGGDTVTFSKERYLQANCQFVVSEDYDVTKHMTDPDTLVDWEKVEELVRLRVPLPETRVTHEDPPMCPICLGPPVAAKMTKCGHTYCWPCALHYFALSDKDYRPCPICFESVAKGHLKTVRTELVPKIGSGVKLEMYLMRRDKNIYPFAKLLKVRSGNISAMIIDRERAELNEKWLQDEREPEAVFIQSALTALSERESIVNVAKIVGEPGISPNADNNVCEDKSDPVPLGSAVKVAPTCHFYTDAFDGECELKCVDADHAEKGGGNSPNDEKFIANMANQTGKLSDEMGNLAVETGDNAFFFYQASTGQHYYLHPFNVRCIQHTYQNLASGPVKISGTVLNVEHHIMTPMLRARYRFLRHLPLATNFAMVELDFDEGILMDETLKHFQDESAMRRRARQRRQRDENRMKAKGEMRDWAMLLDPANYPRYVAAAEMQGGVEPEVRVTRTVPSAQSELTNLWAGGYGSGGGADAPPVFQLDEMPGLGEGVEQTPSQNSPPMGVWASRMSSSATPQQNSPPQPPVQTPNATVNSPSEIDEAGRAEGVTMTSQPSFAEMLRLGKPKAHSPPKRGAANPADAQQCNDNVIDAEIAAPSFAESFGMALESTLGASENEPGISVSEYTGTKSKKGKSKKSKQVLLFTTGAAAPSFQ